MLNGHKSVVIGAPWASQLIVTARTGGAQRDRDGISVFVVARTPPGSSPAITKRSMAAVQREVYFETMSVPPRR